MPAMHSAGPAILFFLSLSYHRSNPFSILANSFIEVLAPQ